MTEPIFKAPLPPEGNGFTPPSVPEPKEQPEHSGEDVKQKILPYLWYILGGTFVLGLIFGLMMGSGEAPSTAPSCPFKYVRNPDIQGDFPLCGRVSRSEPCILYIMNTRQYDRSVEDFYGDVQRLTERSFQALSFENTVYSKLLIPPGAFAQIKVPRQQ